MQYRQEIDGLRALAVCAVLANHFFEGLFPSGYLGVDIFFVISGYVITGSLQNRGDQRLGQFLAGFYARRIKRLVPALAVCVLVSSFLICLVDPTPLEYLRTGLFALFGLANIFLYSRATDYFADAASLNPFTHTWSLGVEEQFYFAFPLLFWLGLHFLPRQIATWGFVGLVLASGVAWWIVTASDPMLAFYMVFFRFWQIGLGALAWLAQHRLTKDGGRLKAVKWAALLVAVGITYAPAAIEPRLATLGVVLATAFVLLLTGPGRARIGLMETRLATYLGRVSYSLYLWHWPVAVMLSWTVGLPPIYGALGLALSLILADLSYRGLERPLRRAQWARSAPRELVRGLLAMLGISVLLFLQGHFLQPHLFQGQRPTLIGVGVGSLTTPYRSTGGAIWAGAPCVLTENKQVGASIDPAHCTIGAPYGNAVRRVLVVGNSFSAAFAAAFDGPGQATGTAFILTSSWGASPVQEIKNNSPWAETNDYYWEIVVPGLIEDLQSGDQVLLASDLSEFSPRTKNEASRGRLQVFETGLRRLSGDLEDRGIGLALLGPLPFAREANCEPTLALPQWYAPGGGPCHFLSRAESLDRQQQFRAVIQKLTHQRVIQALDIFDLFCPDDICGYVNPDGVMMFRDIWSHPSVEAAQLMRPAMQEWLDSIPAEQRH